MEGTLLLSDIAAPAVDFISSGNSLEVQSRRYFDFIRSDQHKQLGQHYYKERGLLYFK